jgi:ribosome biogenesis GTPase / thiamine phosphate phosphatase
LKTSNCEWLQEPSTNGGTEELTLQKEERRPKPGLDNWGWNADLESAWKTLGIPKSLPGRVISTQRGAWEVKCRSKTWTATLDSRLRYVDPIDQPTVGDWVAVLPLDGAESAVVISVLPRTNRLVRVQAGRTSKEQVLGANLEAVLIVTSANQDFNPRRIERYLAMIYAGGARPVVVINKADLVDDIAPWVDRAQAVAPGVTTIATSTVCEEGLQELQALMEPARTYALLGSSGVGKSSITNRLMGDTAQRVLDIREDDDQGRHTTTHRALFRIPSGPLVMDTPGMRELELTCDEEALGEVFGEIVDLASRCRFRDCRHRGEPGCAVGASIDEGELDARRLQSYEKLQREMAYFAQREAKRNRAPSGRRGRNRR